ncbi:MAG: response regulator [Pseudomonadales bacterium]|nr:response regulator [Pseudomonadales bacterium]MDG1443038.1 response regulator [Pseudomonadales bacterium]
MPANILIVDDEINVLSALTRCFKQVGIRADACTSGRQAVSYLMENKYDCIISDYKMPEMNGFEFFEIAAEITATTPRLLLSGHVDSELLETAINNCNIDSFLNKPWSNDELITLVRSSIKEGKKKKRLSQKLKETCQQIESASLHQNGRLPDPIENANIVADFIFKPLYILSGDIVDYEYTDTYFNFAIFDSAGNGTVAAMEAYAMQKQVDLTNELEPKEFTEELNNRYAADKSPSLFTMSLGRIDFATNRLSFCQAGAPNAYILSTDPSRRLERVGLGGFPIGYSTNESYDVQEIQLEKNDCFIGFSENFTDRHAEALETLLCGLPSLSVEALKINVSAWCDQLNQTDDISAVFFQYKPNEIH